MLTLRYLALRPLTGEFGPVMAGAEFDVPAQWQKRYVELEQRGVVRRVYESPVKPRAEIIDAIKAIVGYENKAIVPEQNKKARRK